MSENFERLNCHKQYAVPTVRHLEGWRSHECERGTQECVRHNEFNILRGLTQN